MATLGVLIQCSVSRSRYRPSLDRVGLEDVRRDYDHEYSHLGPSSQKRLKGHRSTFLLVER